MVFTADNISFQGRYRATDMRPGVDASDAVVVSQLTPLAQDIQNLVTGLAARLQSADFGPLFSQYRTQLNLQDAPQVEALIAAALANMPDPEQRLAAVAVHSAFEGTLAQLGPAIAAMGLTANDSGDVDDANTSCVLLKSTDPAETGLYQLRTNGSLVNLNAALFILNIGYYTRFNVTAASQVGRTYAVAALSSATNTIDVVEIPYEDEYTGLGPVVVSNVNRTINLMFSAADFVMGGDGFSLHPAVKAAIDSIPALEGSLNALADLVTTANAALSQQITQLGAQVDALAQTVQAHGNSLSAIQGSVQAVLAKMAASFANVQEILFIAGAAQVRSASGWVPAPGLLAQELSGDANKGLYRIQHDRGVMVTPQYFEANQQGEAQQACSMFRLQNVGNNSFAIEVEKYKPVLIVIGAGLTAQAFIQSSNSI
jgi:hypothetical protein